MVAVVEPDADDLARPADRRPDSAPARVERTECPGGERGLHGLDSARREESGVDVGRHRRDVPEPAFMLSHGPLGARRPVPHESHGSTMAADVSFAEPARLQYRPAGNENSSSEERCISALYPGAPGSTYAPSYDDAGIDEVLVQMVDELGDPVLQGPRDRDVVEDRQVLHELAQPDPAGVGTDRDAELAAMKYTDRISLTLPRRAASSWQKSIASAWNICLNSTRFMPCSPVATPIGETALRMAAWPSTSSGLVGSSIHSGLNSASALHPVDRLGHVPDLVGVDHQVRVPADDVPRDAEPPDVVVQVRADLELDVPVPGVDGLLAEPPELLVGVAEPSRARRVARVPAGLELGDAVAARRLDLP